MLNRANQVIRKQIISQGGTTATIADPKLIFKYALDNMANSIILVHNHPSGNKKPSSADIRLTKKLVEVGKNLELSVLDHVIFTDVGYFSLDRKSTRLNSSHVKISYAVFCLKKKK